MHYHDGQRLTLKNAYTVQTDKSLSNLDRDAVEYPEAKIIDSNKNSFPLWIDNPQKHEKYRLVIGDNKNLMSLIG